MEQPRWPANNPDSLFDICIQYCAENLVDAVCDIADDGLHCLKPHISFPSPIFDALLAACSPLTRQHIGMLRDQTAAKVKHANLSAVQDLSEEELRWVLVHRPIELRFSCEHLTKQSLLDISANSHSLQSLCIDNCSDFWGDITDTTCVDWRSELSSDRPPYVTLKCPRLRRYSVNNVGPSIALLGLDVAGFPLLTRLDLCNTRIGNFSDLGQALSQLHYLHVLSLHNVQLERDLHTAFTAIALAKSLR